MFLTGDATAVDAVPPPTRLRLIAPIVCGCVLAGAALYVAAADPSPTGSAFVPCPLFQATGIYCPGCGLTRAAHACFNGDFAAAIGYNALFPLVALAIVVGWLSWVRTSIGRPPIRLLTALRPSAAMAVGGVVIAFGILRNLPGFDALAP